jgi:arachidonate 15-lipoxygenase
VHRLLKPHFEGTIFINCLALSVLIDDGGLIDSLLLSPFEQMAPFVNKKIESTLFNKRFFRKDLEARSVMSPKLYYPYRDYALPLWDAVSAFVSSIINQFYTDDAAVVNDNELQAFANEIVAEPVNLKGFGDAAYLANMNGPILSTKMYLIEMLTMVIFTASCQHSALNFAQKGYMAYVPSQPMSMAQPELPGTGDNEATWKTWQQWFPSLENCNQQWLGLGVLGTVKYTSLGEYPGDLTKGSNALKKSLDDFQRKLKEICKMIHEKEKDEKVPYLMLHPDQIPASINI